MSLALANFEYKGDEKKTNDNRRDGFFTVGDWGLLDEDGYLFLKDRKSDMIISGGVNIYPAEIEGELLTFPKIGDVAVFGIPHEDWGEEIKAVVAARRGHRGRRRAPRRDLRLLPGPPGQVQAARRRSTSSPSCPATPAASSTSASSATRTGRARSARSEAPAPTGARSRRVRLRVRSRSDVPNAGRPAMMVGVGDWDPRRADRRRPPARRAGAARAPSTCGGSAGSATTTRFDVGNAIGAVGRLPADDVPRGRPGRRRRRHLRAGPQVRARARHVDGVRRRAQRPPGVAPARRRRLRHLLRRVGRRRGRRSTPTSSCSARSCTRSQPVAPDPAATGAPVGRRHHHPGQPPHRPGPGHPVGGLGRRRCSRSPSTSP